MSESSYRQNISAKTKALNIIRGLFRNRFCEQLFIKIIALSKNKGFFIKLIPQEYQYPKGSLRKYNRNSEKFELDISNVIDHAKYFGYAEKGFDNLSKEIKADYVIIDIGANIGTTAVAFAKLAYQGKVVAFEPSLQTFNRLQKHIQMNDLLNVTAVNKGIGKKNGVYNLYHVVETNPGMNRILPEGSIENVGFEKILVTTLRETLCELDIERTDVIKIDVEGYEFEVLQGIEEILEEQKPLLFIELHDNNLKSCGSSATELVSFLKAKNYLVKEAANLKVLSERDDFDNCHIDILCNSAELKK